MFEWEYNTHEFKNMVGAVSANFKAPLWKRYAHLGNHRRRASLTQNLISLGSAFVATMAVLLVR